MFFITPRSPVNVIFLLIKQIAFSASVILQWKSRCCSWRCQRWSKTNISTVQLWGSNICLESTQRDAGCSRAAGGICPCRITGPGVQTAAVITPHVASWVGRNMRAGSKHTEVERRIMGKESDLSWHYWW